MYTDKDYIIHYVKKMLPEYIFDMSSLEGNPFTFPEVKTVIDGYTVGGHKLSDEQQIKNLKSSWEFILDSVSDDNIVLTKDFICRIQSIVAEGEALVCGEFRDGDVGISGTSVYKCPDSYILDGLFTDLIYDCFFIEDSEERAIKLFLMLSYNQLFYDGNKRTARLVANSILIDNCIGVLTIKPELFSKFNALMVKFYDSKNIDEVYQFLEDNCIYRIESPNEKRRVEFVKNIIPLIPQSTISLYGDTDKEIVANYINREAGTFISRESINDFLDLYIFEIKSY